MCFSPSTSLVALAQIQAILSVLIVPEKYLGLPTIAGKNKKNLIYHTLKDHIWKKITGWEGRLLLKAGKEVLVKAVCEAMPTYSMSVFSLPVAICNEIESIIALFWWSKRTERGIHWKALCRHKSEGGLSFHEFISFNKALWAKQGWRLLEFPNSLVARMLKARYFPTSNFLNAQAGSAPSYTCQSNLWDRELSLVVYDGELVMADWYRYMVMLAFLTVAILLFKPLLISPNIHHKRINFNIHFF